MQRQEVVIFITKFITKKTERDEAWQEWLAAAPPRWHLHDGHSLFKTEWAAQECPPKDGGLRHRPTVAPAPDQQGLWRGPCLGFRRGIVHLVPLHECALGATCEFGNWAE